MSQADSDKQKAFEKKLDTLFALEKRTCEARGRVLAVTGVLVRLTMPYARIGDVLKITSYRDRGKEKILECEVVGFDSDSLLALPLGSTLGVAPYDVVTDAGKRLAVTVSESMLGSVVDGLGRPLFDPSSSSLRNPNSNTLLAASANRKPISFSDVQALNQPLTMPVDAEPPSPLLRSEIVKKFATGVKAIDALCTLGEGQRVGLFAGSGVGKSQLLGAITRGSEADVVVVALVGERGREVGDFLRDALGDEGRKKAIVVVATSDSPALLRMRSAQVATAYAEYFRDQGKRVLLVLDSITRTARAMREVGLSAGEPPTRRGFPPSVFAHLPRLLERAGPSSKGSITAIYTVLVEGDDMDEPVADEVRGILDGHIVLSRQIAERGIYPAIDVGHSLSRLMSKITPQKHQELANRFRKYWNLVESKRDLIQLGAYKPGSDLELDKAVSCTKKMNAFLQQVPSKCVAFDESIHLLEACLDGRVA